MIIITIIKAKTEIVLILIVIIIQRTTGLGPVPQVANKLLQEHPALLAASSSRLASSSW